MRKLCPGCPARTAGTAPQLSLLRAALQLCYKAAGFTLLRGARQCGGAPESGGAAAQHFGAVRQRRAGQPKDLAELFPALRRGVRPFARRRGGPRVAKGSRCSSNSALLATAPTTPARRPVARERSPGPPGSCAALHTGAAQRQRCRWRARTDVRLLFGFLFSVGAGPVNFRGSISPYASLEPWCFFDALLRFYQYKPSRHSSIRLLHSGHGPRSSATAHQSQKPVCLQGSATALRSALRHTTQSFALSSSTRSAATPFTAAAT